MSLRQMSWTWSGQVASSLRHCRLTIGDPGKTGNRSYRYPGAPVRNDARNSSTSALDRVRRIGGRALTSCQR